jgi:hypothetical protein
MPDLKGLQQAFQSHLLDGDPAIAAHVVDGGAVNGEQRLGVYVTAYYGRLADTLRRDYPALAAAVGDDEFADLAHAYIRRHPSSHYSLRWFGARMADFLEHADGYRERPYLAELARLEWALVDAFDVADAPVLDEGAAARVPPEAWPALRLVFHPSVRAVELAWNSLARWQAVRDGQPLPEPEALTGARSCLIWRADLTTRYRTLDADEAAALQAARSGAEFAALCEALYPWHDDDAQVAVRAAGLLKSWLAAQMVTAFDGSP